MPATPDMITTHNITATATNPAPTSGRLLGAGPGKKGEYQYQRDNLGDPWLWDLMLQSIIT